MPAAYVIVQMNITDPDRYKQYMVDAARTVKEAGGEYIARGGKLETLEGDWQPQRMGLLKFPSFAQARAWYDSEQYRAARDKRLGATEYFKAVLLEGVDAPV